MLLHVIAVILLIVLQTTPQLSGLHNGQGFGWTPGVGDGLGGLVYCGS